MTSGPFPSLNCLNLPGVRAECLCGWPPHGISYSTCAGVDSRIENSPMLWASRPHRTHCGGPLDRSDADSGPTEHLADNSPVSESAPIERAPIAMLDPGWLYLIAGIALLAATVLIPAMD